ncbi:hypothetical protein BDV29DRAFT_180368 [Aspergillus leporis]|uniref:Uncharacterized protein n=1 Tax=Aspergillus leporis TaxID=41062 RepID=A0A5N5WQE3_9EURO|nr:hypothetical protein BDV29DRAFT_180368 [Aspergillus leporis]
MLTRIRAHQWFSAWMRRPLSVLRLRLSRYTAPLPPRSRCWWLRQWRAIGLSRAPRPAFDQSLKSAPRLGLIINNSISVLRAFSLQELVGSQSF